MRSDAQETLADEVQGSRIVVQALRREGVEYVFGLPGTTLMELIDELGAEQSIRYITVRHEQVAAFMADGYARASGRLGVCIASRGPGAANLSIGVHNAHAEAVPVLAIVGQVDDGHAYRDSFEEVDLLTFFRPITKWGVEVHDSARIPELLQRACRTAVTGRPGGVLVSIPHNVLKARIEQPALQPRWVAGRPVPDRQDLERAAKLLEAAERPLVVVGGGMPSHDRSLIALARMLAAPVVTTWLRKSQYPNDDDNYVGCLGYGADSSTRSSVREADVVLALGCKMSEFSTDKWTLLSPESRLIHIDLDETVVGRVYTPDIGLVADAAAATRLLLESLADRGSGERASHPGRAQRLLRRRQEFLRESRPPAAVARAGAVSSRAVLDTLQAVMGRPDTTLVADAPGFGTWIHRYMTFDRPDSFYGAAGGSMGWGFPAAMGIKLARPDQRVVMVTGDGSFWMVAQDLETAVREEIPVVIVITNNFAFGNTRDRQRHDFGGRYHGVFYGNPDFAEFARLLGAHGERVESDDQLPGAVQRAIDSGRPAIVDVIQDPMEGLPQGLVPPGSRSADLDRTTPIRLKEQE